MKELNMPDLRNQWEPLSTPELEAMLRAELDRKTPDDEKVILLLHILEDRERESPLELSLKETEAWQRYKQKVMSRHGKRRLLPRWLSVAASVVLIVAILFSVVPQQAEAESFWQMLQRITNNVMEYFSGEGKLADLDYCFETDNPGLQQVYDAVMELGVTEPVVPMWLPDGYVIQPILKKDTPMSTGIWVSFLNNDSEIIYKLDVYNGEPAHQYYKDDTHYEQYEQNGVVYYIAQNNGWWTAVWTKENIECHLTLACQEETLRRILRSIHVTEAD